MPPCGIENGEPIPPPPGEKAPVLPDSHAPSRDRDRRAPGADPSAQYPTRHPTPAELIRFLLGSDLRTRYQLSKTLFPRHIWRRQLALLLSLTSASSAISGQHVSAPQPPGSTGGVAISEGGGPGQKPSGEVINAYHKFALPRRWGTGKSASVDGIAVDLYEQNPLAERHIRYGGCF